MSKQSIIEKNNQYKGNLKVEGDLKVLGVAEGKIEVENCIHLEGGRIIGEVKAKCAVINGNIDGKIECSDFFDMEKGVLNSKVKAPKIIISEFADYPDLNNIIEQD
ncbi:conserved hypothetical protein [Thermotomaculum hydrothermale]|uniref:Integral membrane protein CcmA involved in cell shape determination n=1 Tax=Thermotomaculum hydrothermale TaxID=981385 RepID=A0A7R6PQ48_9BACT|nr:polymer-forming cytoskeletal protein [Thermotomaculum hydrothermale]BBB33261.1 conserved hypothetical protein [Thermotomaculum hydrothermale]